MQTLNQGLVGYHITFAEDINPYASPMLCLCTTRPEYYMLSRDMLQGPELASQVQGQTVVDKAVPDCLLLHIRRSRKLRCHYRGCSAAHLSVLCVCRGQRKADREMRKVK